MKSSFIHLFLFITINLMVTAAHAGQVNVELKEINQLSEQGNQAAALERINAYLAANPKNAEAMFMRGVILVELGKRDEAIKGFTELSEKYPNLPEPYNNLAVLYADQGQYDKARKALESAIKTHPSYATAHENLGDIYARLASEAYDKALKLDTANVRAQNKLSMITELFGGAGKRSVTKPISNNTIPTPLPNTPPVVNPPVANPAVTPSPVITPMPVPAAPVAEVKKPVAAVEASQAGQVTAVSEAVNAWARAWSSQNVSNYLASYAKNFKTPAGEARQAWENTRRERITRPAKISVKLNKLDVKMKDDNTAIVHFSQEYKAPGLDATSNKTLDMVKEGSRWVIKQERIGLH